MDIRTKLIIALVLVSLSSMGAIGYFSYFTAADFLKQVSERQLDALAESKARDLRNILAGWRDRVRLVASRTQLRLNLDRYNDDPDEELRGSIQRIVSDAQSSTPSVRGIAVFDKTGNVVAQAGVDELSSGLALSESGSVLESNQVSYLGTHHLDEFLYVQFATRLEIDGRVLGHVVVLLDTEEIASVSGDHTGLGQGGETIIAMRGAQGQPEVLHSLRHEITTSTDYPVLKAAVDGLEQTFMDRHVNYRGAHIWAATRYVEDLDWSVAVQLDREEELQRSVELRELLVNVGLALSAFAVVGGTLLGIYLAAPLRRLAATVERVRAGETELRATVESEDEVGELATALNEFLDQSENQS